jgi:hypothetical protein
VIKIYVFLNVLLIFFSSVQAEDEAIAKIRSIEKRQSREVTFERFMEFDEV